MSDARDYFADPEPQPVVEVTDPFAAADDPGATTADSAQVAELTAHLQRLGAEFTNYRRRVERDRQSNADAAVAKALCAVLPVMDDIERAAEHGELTGGFRAVAERLTHELSALGLERFAREGDVFDPRVHDAVAHLPAADVPTSVCADVLSPGYTYKGILVRPAHVVVTTPAPATAAGGSTT